MWSNLIFFGKISLKRAFIEIVNLGLGVMPYISLILLNLSTYKTLKTIQVNVKYLHIMNRNSLER